MSDFYNKYPYTDFHELNLDWIISEWQKTKAEWNTTEEAWLSLKEFVTTYFDDLDVQEEINNKLDAMAADGTLWQSLENILGVVNPEMFGAVGDGVTDDTTAIQTALDTGKTVVFIHNYAFSDTLNISGETIFVEGSSLISLADLSMHVIIGANVRIEHSNICINLDMDSHTGVGVVMKEIRSSRIDINIINCADIAFYDCYSNDTYGLSYENKIRLNCNAIYDGANILAYIRGGDDYFEEINGRDFKTGIELANGNYNSFGIIHIWISNPALWQNSYLIKNNDANTILHFSVETLIQDTYRYGISSYCVYATIGCFYEVYNKTLVGIPMMQAYPKVNLQTSRTSGPTILDIGMYQSQNIYIPELENKFIYEGTKNILNIGINNGDTIWAEYTDADDIPFGCNGVLSASGTNNPVPGNVQGIVSLFAGSKCLQIASDTPGNISIRSSNLFNPSNAWSDWYPIKQITPTTGTITPSVVMRDNSSYIKKVGNIVELYLNFNIDVSTTAWTTYFTIPDEYTPDHSIYTRIRTVNGGDKTFQVTTTGDIGGSPLQAGETCYVHLTYLVSI